MTRIVRILVVSLVFCMPLRVSAQDSTTGGQGYPMTGSQGYPPPQYQNPPPQYQSQPPAYQSQPPAYQTQPPANQSPPARAPLKLGVQENRVIQPIPPEMQQGQIWDDGIVNKYRPALEWVRIPNEFAGTWQSRIARTIQEQVFQQGQWFNVDVGPGGIKRKNVESVVRGFQKDANGGIWHCLGVEHESRVDSDKVMVIYVKRRVDMRVLSPTKLARYVSSVAVEISHKDKKIVKSYYEEENMVQTISQDANEFQSMTEVTRGVDPYQPEAHGIMEEVCYRTDVFHPVDSMAGIDLKQSFQLYLHNHGLDNLIVAGDAPSRYGGPTPNNQ